VNKKKFKSKIKKKKEYKGRNKKKRDRMNKGMIIKKE